MREIKYIRSGHTGIDAF